MSAEFQKLPRVAREEKDGAILAVGAVVTKEVAPRDIAAGIPAEIIKKIRN